MQKERFSDHNNWFSNICRENLISFLFVWKKQGESFTVFGFKKKNCFQQTELSPGE